MKNTAQQTGILLGDSICNPTHVNLACGLIFNFFPGVKRASECKYRITVSRSKSEGAKPFLFKICGRYNSGGCLNGKLIIYWKLNKKETTKFLYQGFRDIIAETVTEKQVAGEKTVTRWVSLEKI